MGILVSLPINLVTTAGTHLACCFAQSSCACLNVITKSSSTAARLAYVLLFSIIAVLSYVVSNDTVFSKLRNSVPGNTLIPDCPNCFGILSVHRVCVALVAFLLLFIVAAFGLSPATAALASARLAVHKGFWGFKALILFALVGICLWFLPTSFTVFFGTFIAPLLAALFLLLQLLLVVDSAHGIAERLLAWYDDNDSPVAAASLVITTMTLYMATLAIYIYIFIFSSTTKNNIKTKVDDSGSSSGSSETTVVTTSFPTAVVASINLVMALIVSVVSLLPAVREQNQKSGLLQAAVVAVFVSILVLVASGINAISGSPEMIAGATFSGVFLVLALVHLVFGRVDNALSTSASLESVQSSSSAAGGDHDAEHFEDTNLDYKPMLFLMALVFAAGYLSMYITGWHSFPINNSTNPAGSGEINQNLQPTGISPVSGWIHAIASWIMYLLYLWTLLGPVFFPDRDWS